MTITTRSGKGSALTHPEMDANLNTFNNWTSGPATKTAAKALTPEDGVKIYPQGSDGGPFIGVTGLAPGTLTDNGGAFYGTEFIPTGGDGSAGWERDYSGALNVKWFGAKGDGVTNDTIAMQAVVDSAKVAGRSVFIPVGTYLCNITISEKIIITGEGSTKTILKPQTTTSAVITYRSAAPYWTYHAEIKNIKFESSGKTGIGFTFSRFDPANYVSLEEFQNNVKFKGCYFQGFEKGVQFPFGNIGTEFYSCGFSGNKYGTYTLDAKFGGIMHAGNKHFYAGEFSGNDCAIYIHNVTTGFGAIALRDTVIESNKIGLYIYNTKPAFTSVLFDNVWLEANGTILGGTTVLDQWTGSTLSTATFTNRTIIIDGAGGFSSMAFRGGTFTDTEVVADSCTVTTDGCFTNTDSGNNGGPTIVSGANSRIIHKNPRSVGNLSRGVSVACEGYVDKTSLDITSSSSAAGSRWFQLVPRKPSEAFKKNLLYSCDCTQLVTTGGGSFGITSTIVSDGVIFDTCAEFTRAAFLSSQFTRITVPDSNKTYTSGKYYTCTFDYKVTSGTSPYSMVWNRGTDHFVDYVQVPENNKWYIFGAIGLATAAHAMYFDFVGANTDATWRISGIQIHEFDDYVEAANFIASRAYTVTQTISTLSNSATPSVGGGEQFLTGGTTTITDFVDGREGQRITVLSEHAITITDGTNIFLSGSVNFVMASSDSLTLVQKADGNWYEVSRSVN